VGKLNGPGPVPTPPPDLPQSAPQRERGEENRERVRRSITFTCDLLTTLRGEVAKGAGTDVPWTALAEEHRCLDPDAASVRDQCGTSIRKSSWRVRRLARLHRALPKNPFCAPDPRLRGRTRARRKDLVSARTPGPAGRNAAVVDVKRRTAWKVGAGDRYVAVDRKPQAWFGAAMMNPAMAAAKAQRPCAVWFVGRRYLYARFGTYRASRPAKTCRCRPVESATA